MRCRSACWDEVSIGASTREFYRIALPVSMGASYYYLLHQQVRSEIDIALPDSQGCTCLCCIIKRRHCNE